MPVKPRMSLEDQQAYAQMTPEERDAHDQLSSEQREKLEREKVEVWNANHPAGTLISFEEVIGQGETHRSRTRSDASMMCGQAVVWIEAQSSCVSLDHCTVVRG